MVFNSRFVSVFMLRWPIFFNSPIISGVEQFQCRHDNFLSSTPCHISSAGWDFSVTPDIIGPNIFQLWLLFFRFPLCDSTVRPLLSAVLGRTKFWSQKPRIIEVLLYSYKLGVPNFGLKPWG